MPVTKRKFNFLVLAILVLNLMFINACSTPAAKTANVCDHSHAAHGCGRVRHHQYVAFLANMFGHTIGRRWQIACALAPTVRYPYTVVTPNYSCLSMEAVRIIRLGCWQWKP